jgi:hypothetical protein
MTIGSSVGANGLTPSLSEEQAEALMRHHMGKVRRLREQLSSVNSNLRNALKTAKADGYQKYEIDYALALEKDAEDGSGEMLARRRREAQIARWMGHAIGSQPDMFAETEEQVVMTATKEFDAGRRAGMEGETLKVPDWVQEPTQFTAGWHKGQELLQSTLPLTRSGVAGNGEAEQPKPKRGRKPKAKPEEGEGVSFSEQIRQATSTIESGDGVGKDGW